MKYLIKLMKFFISKCKRHICVTNGNFSTSVGMSTLNDTNTGTFGTGWGKNYNK